MAIAADERRFRKKHALVDTSQQARSHSNWRNALIDVLDGQARRGGPPGAATPRPPGAPRLRASARNGFECTFECTFGCTFE